ncbi:hypothetical protein D3C87_1807130 [compost metagenome]
MINAVTIQEAGTAPHNIGTAIFIDKTGILSRSPAVESGIVNIFLPGLMYSHECNN